MDYLLTVLSVVMLSAIISSMQDDFFRSEKEQFERLLNNGIAALKGGDMPQARRWLEKASRIFPSDARPWLWLSATTEDVAEKRTFLERAVAAEPANAAARRGLVLLSSQVDHSRLLAEGQSPDRLPPGETQPSTTQGYACSNCGASLNFEISLSQMSCPHCGYAQPVANQPATSAAGQPIDFVLPTTRAHRWAESQQRVSCANCGALSLLPPGLRADHCPYCGSNRLVASPEQVELLDPQIILLMKLDEAQAMAQAQTWLGAGALAPDDLAPRAGRLHLRPAYYPFWCFDGTLEIPWRCEVNEGTDRNPRWVSRSGTEFQFFDDVLAPGLRSLPSALADRLGPFDLQSALEFKPEYLAGWPALNYDLPLSDASLNARQSVVQQVSRGLYHKIEPGKQKRNIQTGAGQWSGMTYSHLLLPLWVGGYTYQGRAFRVWVNGQTGKADGEKPRDSVKIALYVILAFIVIAFFLFLAYWIFARG